ncbi:hypothetical protein FACS189416_6140 [Bacteroidia bacterium]|nr:hypothetical protein FACS189416_6140 [Bacteroidia bacterium]
MLQEWTKENLTINLVVKRINTLNIADKNERQILDTLLKGVEWWGANHCYKYVTHSGSETE